MDCNCTITELGAYSLMGVYICLLPLVFFTPTSSSCISTRCAFPCAITFSSPPPTQFGEKFIGLLGQYWSKMTWEFALCNDWISLYWWVVGTWSVLLQFWGWCDSACGSMEKWWLRYFSHSFITDLGNPNSSVYIINCATNTCFIKIREACHVLEAPNSCSKLFCTLNVFCIGHMQKQNVAFNKY